jgi:demethylmenaquinone methyltransferase/2-methoxy-6-polyprenyl-1,4-benzoquinol methylase
MTAPHPTLRKYYASDDARPRFVADLFDRAARHYDRINDGMSFGLGLVYRRRALQRARLRPGMTVLDVATGTGLTARAAVSIVGERTRVIGVDPSAGMLEEARRAVAVRLVRGEAEALPFRDGHFDFVAMGYALRHVTDLDVAFVEYARVLKPGGRLLILEIRQPASRVARAVCRWYLGAVVPRLTRVATGSVDAERLTRYYWETITACVPPESVVAALARRFTGVACRTYGAVLTEYEGVRP